MNPKIYKLLLNKVTLIRDLDGKKQAIDFLFNWIFKNSDINFIIFQIKDENSIKKNLVNIIETNDIIRDIKLKFVENDSEIITNISDKTLLVFDQNSYEMYKNENKSVSGTIFILDGKSRADVDFEILEFNNSIHLLDQKMDNLVVNPCIDKTDLSIGMTNNSFFLFNGKYMNYKESFLPVDSTFDKFIKRINMGKCIKNFIYKNACNVVHDQVFINYQMIFLLDCLNSDKFNIGVINSLIQKMSDPWIDMNYVNKKVFLLIYNSSFYWKNKILYYFICGSYEEQKKLQDIFLLLMKYQGSSEIFGKYKKLEDLKDFLLIANSSARYSHFDLSGQTKFLFLDGVSIGEYTVVVPYSARDLIFHGNSLGLCIGHSGKYFEKIEKRVSCIIFLKHPNRLKSVCIELDTNCKVVAISGLKNKSVPSLCGSGIEELIQSLL